MFQASYPPVVSDCPDYWDVFNTIDNNTTCQNKSSINEGLGTATCKNIQPSQFQANGTGTDDVLCEKYKWAKGCNIVWDGVTNNTNACGAAKLA